MTKEQKQEIRRVLLGRTQVDTSGKMTVMGKGEYRLPMGIADGAVATRFLGIGRKTQRLESDLSPERSFQTARKIMADMGHVLELTEQPEAAACLIRYLLTRPTVLVFAEVDGALVLTAWAGRGLSAWISRRRAIKGFLKRMPSGLRVSTEAAPEDKEKKKKKARKERKKTSKRGKKAAKTAADPEVRKEEP